jgi:hypothetical protein
MSARASIYSALLIILLMMAWSLYLEAQARTPQPFRVVVRQAEPPIELFVHEPTGTCFVAYQPGGLVVVDTELCKGKWLILPPIVPPFSPER